MPYIYVATTKEGTVKRGKSDLASRDSVISWLERDGLVPITVDEANETPAVRRFLSAFSGTISHTERLLFTKHLSIMLRAGLMLMESLRILEEQASGWRFRRLLAGIAKVVDRGEKLSDALAAYPQTFSAFYINIVRAGEISGNLEQNLNHLADQMAKDRAVKQKVQTALLYPSIVVFAALAIGYFFAIFVLPQVAGLFGSLRGIELPWVTVVLLRISDFTRQHTFSTFFGTIIICFAAVWLARLKSLAPITHRVVLHLPVVGKIVKDVNLSRFALVLGTSLRSGIDITKAVEIASSVLGNIYYRKVLDKALVDIQKGIPISETLIPETKLFPRIVSRMIAVGEKTGRLEDVLNYLAEFYDLEVETSMKNLSTILEPLLLLFIGAVTMALAFAIIVPIYNYVSAIRRI